MALSTDKNLKVEKVGKVWRAQYKGVTICSTMTKQSCIDNAEFLMRTMTPRLWQALVTQGYR